MSLCLNPATLFMHGITYPDGVCRFFPWLCHTKDRHCPNSNGYASVQANEYQLHPQTTVNPQPNPNLNPNQGTDNALAATLGIQDAFVAVLTVIKGTLIHYDVLEVLQAETAPAEAQRSTATAATPTATATSTANQDATSKKAASQHATQLPRSGPGNVRAGARVTLSSCCVGWGFIADVLEGKVWAGRKGIGEKEKN